ncbi:MAG TPA: EsaB/YukD family protein [Streptosporangiaceae bacterium]|nr:EsaB/YukD family protein [Streptosporangiaceae bacterium]
MSPAKHQLVRVTVVSPFGQHEIDLPVDSPVSGFLPDLLAMAGLQPSPAQLAADGWHLTDTAGRSIPGQSTLAAYGIEQGAVIQLRRPGAPEAGQPWSAQTNSAELRAGVGVLRDKGAVSRHLPRSVASAAPPDDNRTPLERAEAVLPPWIGKGSRLWSAGGAFFRAPGTAVQPAEFARGPVQGDDGRTGSQGAVPGTPRPVPGQPSGGAPRRPLGLMQSPWTGQGGVPRARSGGPGTPGLPGVSDLETRPPGPGGFGGPGTGHPGAGQRPAGRPGPGVIPNGSPASPAGERPGQSVPPHGVPGTGSGARSARPHAHEPGKHRYRPADLTIATEPTRMERARAKWRELDNLSQLDARITGPRLLHCATIAVVSPKGGVGKTTVTALLGTLFSLLRRDPIVAVDTNPDFGSLGRVLTPDQSWYVDDLARLVLDDDELSLTSLDALLGRAVHGLLVVPAPTDPDRMRSLDEEAYRRVLTRLKDFFSLILLDCGTGLQDPALAAAIAGADQVVLLTDAQPATASLVAESTELLHQWGRPITVVVNRMPARGAKLDVTRLSRYLPAARGMVVVPDDVVAATRLSTGRFDWRDAPDTWQFAIRRLATVLVAEWERLGLARLPG